MRLAALCHFYPGYTLDALREMPHAEVEVLLDVMQAMSPKEGTDGR